MSVKNVMLFFAKVEEDKALQTKIVALHKKAKENIDEAIADLVGVASAAGFKFTHDDYAKARAAHKHEDTKLHTEVLGQDLGCCNSNWSCCRVKTM
jgi:predicted ribosomally synthesized peptide with nif11-like leader